jgi:hypothetical protein
MAAATAISTIGLGPRGVTIARSESMIGRLAMTVPDVLMTESIVCVIVHREMTAAGEFTTVHRGTIGAELLTIVGALKAVAEVMVEVSIGKWRSGLKRRPNGLWLWF